MLNIICPSNLESTERQIQALQAIMPLDNEKDREIHGTALKQLLAHRERLVLK